jgi:hypothetical protein
MAPANTGNANKSKITVIEQTIQISLSVQQ